MSELDAAPVGGEPEVVTASVPAQSERFEIDAKEAARQLANYRWKRDNPEAAKAEEPAQPPQAATEDSSDPPQEAPAEATTEQAQEPAEEALPPIEPPRSWTKDEKEEFATYPREAQEKIARREQDRETALRRSQNEAAEQRKAIEAERVKVDQARQQYEAALPALLQTLQEQQQGEFSDIKTMADVQKLADTDWPRYARWDAQQKKLAAVTQEVRAAQSRQQAEAQSKWSEYSTKEDQLLVERAPELKDPAHFQKVSSGALSTLKDVGFSEQDLAKAWNGEQSIPLRDHRMQLLILDAMKYREAKAGISKPVAKPVPPVQRPGVSKPASSGNEAQIKSLEERFNRTGNAKDAARLLLARRAAG